MEGATRGIVRQIARPRRRFGAIPRISGATGAITTAATSGVLGPGDVGAAGSGTGTRGVPGAAPGGSLRGADSAAASDRLESGFLYRIISLVF